MRTPKFSDPSLDNCGSSSLSDTTRHQHTEDYVRTFDQTKNASGAPSFVWVKGEPLFLSKMSGDMVNRGKVPKTPCRNCGKCH